MPPGRQRPRSARRRTPSPTAASCRRVRRAGAALDLGRAPGFLLTDLAGLRTRFETRFHLPPHPSGTTQTKTPGPRRTSRRAGTTRGLAGASSVECRDLAAPLLRTGSGGAEGTGIEIVCTSGGGAEEPAPDCLPEAAPVPATSDAPKVPAEYWCCPRGAAGGHQGRTATALPCGCKAVRDKGDLEGPERQEGAVGLFVVLVGRRGERARPLPAWSSRRQGREFARVEVVSRRRTTASAPPARRLPEDEYSLAYLPICRIDRRQKDSQSSSGCVCRRGADAGAGRSFSSVDAGDVAAARDAPWRLGHRRRAAPRARASRAGPVRGPAPARRRVPARRRDGGLFLRLRRSRRRTSGHARARCCANWRAALR